MSDGVAQEIKAKIDIVQLVGDYVTLKKAGSTWKAPCPFHSEKSASFMVNPDRQRYHCFGCGEDGDAFGFVMKMEGVEFKDALRSLAKKAGITLAAADNRERSERSAIIEVNNLAARFWHEVLMRAKGAEHARNYVTKRGLLLTTLEDWKIGYTPDAWDTTINFFRKKGFKDDLLIKSGIAVPREKGAGCYDRFRGRLMFPIRDASGDTVGFTGRILPTTAGKDPDDIAKYVNSPQTLAYNKSQAIFGIDKARQEIRRSGVAVLVEGNMDVVVPHQAGFKNIVASSGTAITSEQFEALGKFAKKVVLSFDNDVAGEAAARKAIDLAAAAGFSVRMLRLPDGIKDPDECVQQNPELWRKAIAEAVPHMAWFIALAKDRCNFNDADSKKEAAGALLAELAKLPDPVERSHWLRQIAELFQTPEPLLQERMRDLMKKPVQGVTPRPGTASNPVKSTAAVSKNAQNANKTDRLHIASEYIMALAAAWPAEVMPLLAERLSTDALQSDFRPLYKELFSLYSAEQIRGPVPLAFRFDSSAFTTPDFGNRVAVLELLAQKEFSDLTGKERREHVAKLTDELKKSTLVSRQRELTAAMSLAEKAGDAQRIREIQEQLKALIS